MSGGPDVSGRAKNGLDEAEEVDGGGDQGGDFGEVENVQRGRVADLLTPPGQQEADHQEEEGEEHRIGQGQRQSKFMVMNKE